MHEALIQYITAELAGDASIALAADDDLLNTGLVNSIAIMRLIAFVEEQFGVAIPPQDMIIDHFISVNALVAYIEAAKAS